MFWRVLFRNPYSRKRILCSAVTENIFKMPFYAVAKGRTSGIFMTWSDCEAQVKGFSGARYKKFDSIVSAQEFIGSEGAGSSRPTPASKPKYNSSTSKSYYSNQNLKRSYSTSSNKNNDTSKTKNSKAESSRPNDSEDFESTFTDDDDDDLNTMILKQMDDVEKRLQQFEKGVDKIIKKNTSKSSGRSTIMLEPPKPKRQRKTSHSVFHEDSEGYVQVYTDGACSGNGRSGARAGLGVYWGDGHDLNTSEPVSGRATNNCGEIQAATCAIKLALQNGVRKLAIYTDSKFLINSVTKWIPGWKSKGWKLRSGEPVKNEIDFKELDSLRNQLEVKWVHVDAHKGIHGNEMADQLAKAGAAKYNK